MREFGLLCGERQVHSGHVQGWPPLHVAPEEKRCGQFLFWLAAGNMFLYISSFLGVFLHRQREGFQRRARRLGDSGGRRRPGMSRATMLPSRTLRLRPGGEETRPKSWIQTSVAGAAA